MHEKRYVASKKTQNTGFWQRFSSYELIKLLIHVKFETHLLVIKSDRNIAIFLKIRIKYEYINRCIKSRHMSLEKHTLYLQKSLSTALPFLPEFHWVTYLSNTYIVSTGISYIIYDSSLLSFNDKFRQMSHLEYRYYVHRPKNHFELPSEKNPVTTPSTTNTINNNPKIPTTTRASEFNTNRK